MKHTLAILAALAVVLFSLRGDIQTASAQQSITWVTLADITGSGAAVALGTTGSYRFCQIQAPSTNAADVRWGDSNVSASRGAGIAAGGGQFIPVIPQGPLSVVDLTKTFAFIANGDKLRLTCGQ